MESPLVFCSPPMGHVPLLYRLEAVRAGGFSLISLLPGDVWALEEQGIPARDIAARIADAGLAVGEVDCAACWMERHKTAKKARGGGNDDLSALLRSLTAQRVVETAARIGARSVVAIDMGAAPPPLDEAAEGFAALCDLAAEHGLLAHIEFLPASAIRDLSAAWAIVEAAGRPNGGLTIDAWHFFRSGSTLAQLAAIPGDRIHTVQLNDGPLVPAPGADPWDEMMTGRHIPDALGTEGGGFDLAGLVRTLDTIGSTAPIGVEVFNAANAIRPVAHVAQDWASSTRALLAKARGQA